MVNEKRSAAAKKNPNRKGRPLADKKDLRSERTAMRMHPDLVQALNEAAAEIGINRSVYIERVLVNHLNSVYMARDERPLDAIGRRMSDEAIERMRRNLPINPNNSIARLREAQHPGVDYRQPSYYYPEMPDDMQPPPGAGGPLMAPPSPYGFPRRPPQPIPPKKQKK